MTTTTGTRRLIGTWHERTARELRENHTSYAADWRIIRTRPGEYPVYVTSVDHRRPEAYWVLVSVDAEQLDGATYSGFGGLNFGETKLPAGVRTWRHEQLYFYQVHQLIDDGVIVLNEDAADLVPEIDRTRERSRQLDERHAIQDALNAELRASSRYLAMRWAGFTHEYAADLASRWNGDEAPEDPPTTRQIMAGDMLAVLSKATAHGSWILPYTAGKLGSEYL